MKNKVQMKQAKIPNTDINISQICLGTMTFGTPVCRKEAVKLTHLAFEFGINFIDTANMYEGYKRVLGSSGGEAEEIIGEALLGRRHEFIVATKVGMCVGKKVEDKGTSPLAIRKQLELSLKRLKTDYIDIYYLHNPDTNSQLIETLDELDRLIIQGKIRHYGISNYSKEQLLDLLIVADMNKLPRPVVCQPPLSLLNKNALENLIPLCKEQNIAVVPYQILQGGILTGKYKQGIQPPMQSRKVEKSEWMWEITKEVYNRLEEIELLAKNENISMTQYAIRWILKQPAVISAIIGVKNIFQLEEAVNSIN